MATNVDPHTGRAGDELTRLRERCRALEQGIRRSERERRHAIERMLRAEERERRRLAAELHDDTVQVLTACLLSLDRVGHAVETAERERIAAVVASARRTLGAATDRTRRLMFELRPTSLHREGLATALRELAEETGEEAGVRVSVAVPDERYPYVVEETAYRAVREAVVNVRKHARATALAIELRADGDRLHGRVMDDGRGFDVAAALERGRRQRHMGLDAVRERVRMAGGSVDVHSSPGAGTTVSFEIPLA